MANFGMPPIGRADAFRTDCNFEISEASNPEKIASPKSILEETKARLTAEEAVCVGYDRSTA